jgi:hypothetical protein
MHIEVEGDSIMLGAKLEAMLKHKAEQMNRPSNPQAVEHMRKQTKAERAKERERIEVEAKKEAARQELMRQRWELFNKRNSIAYAISEFSIVRKDGKNVARKGRKADRNALQAELARVNRRIDKVNSQLNPPREPSDKKLHRRARYARDVAVCNLVVTRPSTARFNEQSAYAQELAVTCRPANGYPAPPFRRGEEYPDGGLLKAPKGGVSMKHMAAERDRMATCMRTIYKAEGYSDRLLRMYNHYEWLNATLKAMSKNPHMRKSRGSKTYTQRAA